LMYAHHTYNVRHNNLFSWNTTPPHGLRRHHVKTVVKASLSSRAW
jgi:hypothetical protein